MSSPDQNERPFSDVERDLLEKELPAVVQNLVGLFEDIEDVRGDMYFDPPGIRVTSFPWGEEEREYVKTFDETATNPGHTTALHIPLGSRQTRIDRQLCEDGLEMISISREPKKKKMRTVVLKNSRPLSSEEVVADLAAEMRAIMKGEEPPTNDLRLGDFLSEGTMQVPIFEEDEGDFNISILRRVADGQILSFSIRHPMMRTWPNPDHPAFATDPAPEIIRDFLLAPMSGAPQAEKFFLPFMLTVGGANTDPRIRFIMEKAAQELLPSLLPQIQEEITAAISAFKNALPEPRGKQYKIFEPRERGNMEAETASYGMPLTEHAVEMHDVSDLTSKQQENLCRGAWNLLGRRGRKESIDPTQALDIFKQHGFILYRINQRTMLGEVWPTPDLNRFRLAKEIPNDLFTSPVSSAHQLGTNFDGKEPATVAELMRFSGKDSPGVRPKPVFHGAIESRGGLAREVVDVILDKIGCQLELPVRLPMTLERLLLVKIHPEIGHDRVLEWTQDWHQVGPDDSRGFIVGGGGRKLGSVELAEHHDSAYGNVIFRIVIDLEP